MINPKVTAYEINAMDLGDLYLANVVEYVNVQNEWVTYNREKK